jgi:hypothetical protein
VGFFCGKIVRKYGLKILGSPLPGWTTHYMGPVLVAGRSPDRELFSALDEWVFRELRCAHFEFLWRDAAPADLDGRGYGAETLPSFLVDLRADPEQIYRNFHESCRWSVRKAEREGLIVEETRDPAFVDEYYEQLKDVFAKQGLVPTYPKSRVEKLLQCLGPEHLLAIRARTPQGECAATAIVTLDRQCGYLWGVASWRKHQKLRANELLQWRLMHRLKDLGIGEYDLGGGGDYKSKYGGVPIGTPWFFKSRSVALGGLRAAYRSAIRARQRLRGWLNAKRGGDPREDGRA